MASFKKIEALDFPRVTAQVTEESLKWKELGLPVTIKDVNLIHNIDIMSEEPYNFAVTCSSRVRIFNPISREVTARLTKFRQAAYGAVYRSDNRLIAAGSDEGVVKLFDVKSKTTLRLFSGHTGPTQRVQFTSGGTKIVSFSDDRSISFWDIPSEARLLNVEAHDDYVRAGAVCSAQPDLALSGSYDHKARLIDLRTGKSVVKVNHEDPIEAVLMFPTGGLFVTAGGTTVKVWDATAGRMLAKLCQHHKTVTCLSLARNGQRLLSGSLDRHVRIYDIASYKVVHTMDYPSPVLSMAVSRDDSLFIVGSSSGLVSVQKRKPPKIVSGLGQEVKSRRVRRMEARMPRPFVSLSRQSEATNVPSLGENDITIEAWSRPQMRPVDRLLQRFQFAKALKQGLKLSKTFKDASILAGVCDELLKRKSFRGAVKGLSDTDQIDLVDVCNRYLTDSRFGRKFLDITANLIEILEKRAQTNPLLYREFQQLLKSLDREIEAQKSMMQLGGMIQQLLANSVTERTLIDDLQRRDMASSNQSAVLPGGSNVTSNTLPPSRGTPVNGI